MSKAISLIATLSASLIGAAVAATAKGETVPTNYKISALSTKTGSLKDGTKAEYLILTKEGDDTVTIELHPNTAKKLMETGKADGFELVKAEATTGEGVGIAGPEVVAAEDKRPKAKKVKKADEPVEPKAPSKKELFVQTFLSVYNAAVDAGGDALDGVRKAVKEQSAELGLSDACFNTYYQNCKAGKAGWTE